MTDTDRQAYSRVRIANQLNQKQWNSYSILNIWDGVFDICDGVFDIWDVLFGIWYLIFGMVYLSRMVKSFYWICKPAGPTNTLSKPLAGKPEVVS